jgi:SpoIIAA-like
MPIVWGVNHAARLVSMKATGELNRTDIEAYLDGLVTAATLSYRKVLDMTECRLALTSDDMAAIGARIRAHEAQRRMGSVAVIAGSNELYDQIRRYDSFVDAQRPLKVFRDAAAAYAWLTDGLPEGVELAETQRAAARPAAIGAV